MECKTCGTANLASARFCLNCGGELSAHCSRCERELPPEARFCPACGQAVAAASPPPPEQRSSRLGPVTPERKLVTILFADFAGFTTYAEKTDAEDVHEQMRSLWERLDAIIVGHGGTVEKHMGDAVMALFGDKQAREDAPAQAVRAALALQTCLREREPGAARPPLTMRVGVHTGLVVLEPMSGGEFQGTGDAINLANRLEAAAPPGGVLISHDTYRNVYGLFTVKPLPPLLVKGKAEPVQAYLVSGAKARGVARQMRGVEGIETEMVGRQLELEVLQSALQSVLEERQLRLVTIIGEAGIGKSRLVHEFQKWFDLLPQSFRFFRGQATADMPGLPFALMRDVFAARFEIQDNDSAAVAKEKLETGVVKLVSGTADATAWASQEPQLMAQFIGQLLGLDFSASPQLRGLMNDPEQIRQRGFHCLQQFFSAIARGTPQEAAGPEFRAAVLVAEDLHWSDDGSLNLIDYLARNCAKAPLLIVCLARPTLLERRPAWGEGLPAHQRLHLDSLSRRESRALVGAILRKAPEVPQALQELIVGGGEGNPFYIEEIVKMLIDQRVIVPEAEHWRIEPERLAAARVPATLTGVLQARLDELAPQERAALQRASVVGRVFWDNALEQLCAPAEPARASEPSASVLNRSGIAEALAGLRRKELIFRRETSAFAGATEYVFKHELLRTATYESVLKKLRRELHARVAAWVMHASGERSTEFAGLVASHFEQAGRGGEAAEWYGKAGHQARAGYEPAMAIEYFGKALKLLPEGKAESNAVARQHLDWLEGLGESLGAQARFAEAIESFSQMRGLAERLGDPLAQTRAWNGLAFLEERRGDNHASLEAARQAEELARGLGESGRRERIRALHFKGWAWYRLTELDAVLALADETLELCTASGDRQSLATSFKLRGVVHLQRGDCREADRYFEQGLVLCRELGDRRNAAAMWNNLGESARLRGDFSTAVEFYQKALAISRQIGSRESELIYLTNLNGARLGLPEFAEAEAGLRELIPLAIARKSSVLSEAFSFLSEACLGQDKLADALQAAQRSLALAKESGNELDLAIAWRVLGRAAAKMNNRSEVAGDKTLEGLAATNPSACFTHSLRLFKKMKAKAEQARTLRACAEFETHEGQTTKARRSAETARRIFARLNMGSEVERTDALLRECGA
jgi:class 3 adenylate cyclase/tetratricopeptide (TPR) repeat protein